MRISDWSSDVCSSDLGFYRMWALDGISRSQAALGRPAEAARSLEQALASFDQVRARFRSEEFKMGLFSDLQKVFERAIGLYTELDQPARAFDISERSRARALLDSVSDRSEEHTSELQSLMRISYAVFCLNKNNLNSCHYTYPP